MWYYVQNNQRQGPADEQTITTLIHNGTIQRMTLVWQEGMTDWQPAGESALQEKFLVTPPAAPTTAPAAPAPTPTVTGTPPYSAESLRTLWLWFAWCIGAGLPLCLIFIGIVPLIAGVVISYVLLYRFWALIQDGQARTSPGKAVGFSFIPFFNFYWMYIAFVGLAQDMNRYCDERNIAGPRVTESLALTYFILTLCTLIPYLGSVIAIAEIVVFIIVMKQFVDQGMQIIHAKQTEATT